jgi:predicted GNAT family acetyltransferase
MSFEVTHSPQAGRFEARLGARRALCSYRLQGGVMVLHHTEVPPEAQGQGVAAALVAAALAWAQAQGLRVRPACSYVAAYMRRHPETQALREV